MNTQRLFLIHVVTLLLGVSISHAEILVSLKFSDWSLVDRFQQQCNTSCYQCYTCGAKDASELTLATVVQETESGTADSMMMSASESKYRSSIPSADTSEVPSREHYWRWNKLPATDGDVLKGSPAFVNPLTINVQSPKSRVLIWLELSGGSRYQSCEYSASKMIHVSQVLDKPTTSHAVVGDCYTLRVEVTVLCAPFFYGPTCMDRIRSRGAGHFSSARNHNQPGYVPLSEAQNYFNLFVLTGILLCLTITAVLCSAVGYSCMRLRRRCESKKEAKRHSPKNGSSADSPKSGSKIRVLHSKGGKSKNGIRKPDWGSAGQSTNGAGSAGAAKLIPGDVPCGTDSEKSSERYGFTVTSASANGREMSNATHVMSTASTFMSPGHGGYASKGVSAQGMMPGGTKPPIPLASVPPHMATIEDYDEGGTGSVGTLGNRSLKEMLVEETGEEPHGFVHLEGPVGVNSPDRGEGVPKLSNYSYTGYY